MEHVEDNTPALEEMITLGQALARLEKNRDFKKIVENLFLKDGADILTQNLWKVKDREKLYEEYMARSLLHKHFEMIRNDAISAAEELKDDV